MIVNGTSSATTPRLTITFCRTTARAVRLSPTARARNVANLTGDLDLSKTNALRGALKLAAESIDVTPYYDLFAATPPAGAVGSVCATFS